MYASLHIHLPVLTKHNTTHYTTTILHRVEPYTTHNTTTQHIQHNIQTKNTPQVLWDVFPRIDTVHHYDQVIVYTHALLSLWQRNAYAFLSDVDELLVTPEPVNIVTLINKGCLRGIHQVWCVCVLCCVVCMWQHVACVCGSV